MNSYFIKTPKGDECKGWKNTPRRIILHYTATHDDTPLSSIANGHKARFGVEYYIAYHYLIKKNGEIVNTRPEDCGSISVISEEINCSAIHIAYIGEGKPNDEQIKSLVFLTRDVMFRYGIDRNMVDGHANVQPKNHAESMEGMFGSKEEFIKKLRIADSISIYGKKSPELSYMWSAWGDKDFIGTIFQESRMNNTSKGDGGQSIGYCQIHKGHQPGWYTHYKSLSSMEDRLNYCHELYVYAQGLPGGVGSRFHGYNKKDTHIKNILIQ